MVTRNLEAGDEVLTLDGIAGYVVSLDLKEFDEYITVYNLEIDDFHTYFVGDENVLVHNTYSKPNKMQQEEEKGQAPKGEERVDKGYRGEPY